MEPSELEQDFLAAGLRHGVTIQSIEELFDLLTPLRTRSVVHYLHYEHSLRVGMLAAQIACITSCDPPTLFRAGALHDVGKCKVCESVLGKTSGWTDEDMAMLQTHVIAGYEIVREYDRYHAEIIVRHHQYQELPYPLVLPRMRREFTPIAIVRIERHARLLALADVYDALHRSNSKFSDGGEARTLSDSEIREQMYNLNPDEHHLIARLYAKGVFV